ncbi:MAG: response regulator [Lachnospiraceae bacterium]|nr:response regulator [Lachnospiraceae bacterium]
MDDIRKERLIISICTLAGLSCILQNFFGGWEFWVPALVLVGLAILWFLHISHRMEPDVRISMYFTFAAFLLFYHGIHDTSLFDISVSIALFMVTFTVADRIWLLNIILAEYFLVMVIQFWFLYSEGRMDMNAFEIMRMIYHVVTVLTMYVFSRITVNRRSAEKIKRQKWLDTVRENDSDMEDFLSNISHELRTPVNVISGMTTLMQKKYGGSELESIQDAGIRLAHQIEDIQDYTEIKRGELMIDEENYMCVSLINDVVTGYEQIDRSKELELIVNLAPEMPAMLRGDIQKLHKLFRHLLENAVKFTKRGGIYVKLFPVIQEYGINLTVEVTDTGIGMTRADMSRVTKGMYQANKKRDRSTGGIGIGLPIVYGIVHKMGGFVNITSTRGSGTTVRISIPQQVIDPTPCLMVNDEAKKSFLFFIKPEKYKVPELRDFYRDMAVTLATGIGAKLYSAADRRELEHLTDEAVADFIFTGEEEYSSDHDMLDELARKGYRVVVSANTGFKVTPGSGVIMMPKPLYAFPVVRIINGDGSNDGPESETGKMRLDGIRALVVDDEAMNLVVATGLLRDYGITADTAGSGLEAIEKYESGIYDVIFMDHMMPEMDGAETARRIRQIADASYRKPIIVALTANALSGAREMFMKEGFDGFIAKPINISEFERVMKNVLPEEMITYEMTPGDGVNGPFDKMSTHERRAEK